MQQEREGGGRRRRREEEGSKEKESAYSSHALAMRQTDRADEAPMSAQGLGEPRIQKLHLHCNSSIPVGVASHDPSWLTPPFLRLWD